MRRYPLYIFDLDGTLYRGAQAIPDAAETIQRLRAQGSQVRFVTNNSSQTAEAQAERLSSMGIQAHPEEVLTSGIGAAHYLRTHDLCSAFVVGEPGLVEALARNGIRSSTGEEPADAVVVGICRDFRYGILDEALQRILRGARFVATNTDATYPMEGDRVVPGAGAIVAAVEACSGVSPIVLGKPNTLLLEMALGLAQIEAKDALVVGDRYETDIVSGKRAGCDTLLVLTGVTKTAPPGQASAASLIELLG